jgi:microcin C transport system substrate-binding protein
MIQMCSRLAAAFSIVALVSGFVSAMPAKAEKRHGLSIFGKLKYPADFKHFDYVNPNAPKGGKFSFAVGGVTFDSFNPFILRGSEEPYVSSLMFESLMISSEDEPASMYGLVAHSVEVADDGLSVTFYMRPEARFSDGTPMTADDVVFSFDTLKKDGHPRYRIVYRDVVKAEALDKHTVKFSFKGTLVRDLPQYVAGMPILSKAYYSKVDFKETTLTPPVASGPYKLVDFRPNAYVRYQRRDDYWGKDLPVNRGRFNFDVIEHRYYADRTAAFLGFTSGQYEFREEFTSKVWATEYNFPAIKAGYVKRDILPDNTPSGTQGWFINTRRAKFADPRVREALDYAFDFRWTNKNLFFGLYKRTTSYFENSPMEATGKPSAAELALLEPFRAQLPKSVFGEAYVPPISDGSGRDRKLLGMAHKLLTAAGYKLTGGRRIDKDGKQLRVEFLRTESGFDRIISPFVSNLKALGIDAFIRPVDPAQYERRLKTFDFDIITQRYVMSLTPGVELRSYFSSKVADVQGSRNLAGIKDPVVDALIDKVMNAKSRDELDTAVKTMDRVLRAGHYWVSHWYKGSHQIAFWDRFSRPKIKPKYARGVIDLWWYDAAKAAKIP